MQLPYEGRFSELAKFVKLRRYRECAYSMMIGSYLDESFDKQPFGVYVVGGILARYLAIFELDRRWEQLRQRPDIDIEYFKAYECERGSKQFAKFCAVPGKPTAQERDRLNSISHEFLDLIVHPVPFDSQQYICVHGVGVIQKDFYEVIQDPKAQAVLGSNPFRLAYDLAMIQCAWAMKQLGDAYTVTFICDEDEEHSHVVSSDFKTLKDTNPKAAKYMDGFTTLDEKGCEPLQAADAAVYEVRKAIKFSLKDYEVSLRKQFRILSDSSSMFLITYCEKKHLLEIVNTHKPGQRFYLDDQMDRIPPVENIKF